MQQISTSVHYPSNKVLPNSHWMCIQSCTLKIMIIACDTLHIWPSDMNYVTDKNISIHLVKVNPFLH